MSLSLVYPGSIPGRGVFFARNLCILIIIAFLQELSRTMNPGIRQNHQIRKGPHRPLELHKITRSRLLGPSGITCIETQRPMSTPSSQSPHKISARLSVAPVALFEPLDVTSRHQKSIIPRDHAIIFCGCPVFLSCPPPTPHHKR